MYKFKSPIGKTIINLPNGIYQFDFNSGTGKTFLKHRLQELRRLGEPVRGLDCYDINDGLLDNIIKSGEFWGLAVLLLDRFDMYPDNFSETYKDSLIKLSKSCIILIDVKSNESLGSATIVRVKLTDGGGIEVYEHGICV